MVTVPVTMPVHWTPEPLSEEPGQHMPELPPQPPIEPGLPVDHVPEPARRSARPESPNPDATWGSTVTSITKLAAPMTTTFAPVRPRSMVHLAPGPARPAPGLDRAQRNPLLGLRHGGRR